MVERLGFVVSYDRRNPDCCDDDGDEYNHAADEGDPIMDIRGYP
jgi:hypothetical protein